jgi:DNA-binding beta-propeller fold protein YncE
MDVYETVDIGSDFLGYRIEELIGRGGMGVVYRAYDLRLKRPVALKLVAPALARDEQFRTRFARESELVMSLEHPNVVPIYDAGEVDGRVYLAMRLVDGTDLGSLLRTEGALEPTRAIAICSQIAAALDAAHTRGLVHRDVKPSNILLDGSDHAYLADFGLSGRLADEGAEPGEDRFVGTPAYLAPEQLESGPVDGRADVYSLGCVLYECLTGEPVFPRGSRLAVAWAHLEEEPPRASTRHAGLPQSVDGVITRAMAKEPGQRFATCGALVSAAEDAFGRGEAGPTRRRRLLLLIGAIALATAVTIAVVETAFGHAARHEAIAPLLADANTLARIDTATSKVSNVFPLGADPVVAAASDYTVWAYSRGAGTITQINAETNQHVETTPVSHPADCCDLFTGPVLGADPAADPTGAWFVEGGFAGEKALLVHLPVGALGKSEYPLPLTPTGVAAGGGAVWVVGHNARGHELLRIAPDSGRVTKTVRFRASAPVDSIAFGYGSVWVLSSATATLYKINPSSARQEGKLVVANSRATRPEILPRGPNIFVSVTGDGGRTYFIDPSPLRIDDVQGPFGPPDWQEYEGDLGSLWWYDWPHRSVYRQEVADGGVRNIRVTRSRPKAGGPCLTSMAVVSGSIWVTVAPSVGGRCSR